MVQRWQGEEGVEGIEERQSKEDTKEMEKEVLIIFFPTYMSSALAPVLLNASVQPVWMLSNCAV